MKLPLHKRIYHSFIKVLKYLVMVLYKIFSFFFDRDDKESTGTTKKLSPIEGSKPQKKNINNSSDMVDETKETDFKTYTEVYAPEQELVVDMSVKFSKMIDKVIEVETKVKVSEIKDKVLIKKIKKMKLDLIPKLSDRFDTDDFQRGSLVYNETKKLMVLREKDIPLLIELNPEEVKYLVGEEVSEKKKDDIAKLTPSSEQELKNDIAPQKSEIAVAEPHLDLRRQVEQIVIGSSLVLAGVAKELLTSNPDLTDDQKIELQAILPVEMPAEESAEKVENKPQDAKEDKLADKPQEKVEKQDKKQEKKEEKKEEKKVEKKEEKKEEKKPEINIVPFEKNTLSLTKDSITEIKKEELEDKNYEHLEDKINNAIDQIELFIIKNEKVLTKEQREKLEAEKKKLYDLKNNLNKQKEKDIKNEEQALESPIHSEEKEGMVNYLESMKIEHLMDLREHSIQKLEDLNLKNSKEALAIENSLINKKLKRAYFAAGLTSLAFPFIRNKFLLHFITGKIVNKNLRYIRDILNHRTELEDVNNFDNIHNGADALNASIDLNRTNLGYLGGLEEKIRLTRPSFSPDTLTRMGLLRSRLHKTQTKLKRKRQVIDKYCFKKRKNVKILKKDDIIYY